MKSAAIALIVVIFMSIFATKPLAYLVQAAGYRPLQVWKLFLFYLATGALVAFAVY